MNIDEKIDSFKTKYEEGFTYEEIEILLKEFPGINRKKFDDAMMCNTCAIRDGLHVIYPWDVRTALYCGVENRDQTEVEFD